MILLKLTFEQDHSFQLKFNLFYCKLIVPKILIRYLD